MASIKRLYSALNRPGPHRVLRGDLAYAGLAGVVYTPASGYRLPAVAFGHDWLTRADRYAGLLEHLASWGIVAAAPDTGRGLAPSVLESAADLGRALDIATDIRLGPGRISIDRGRLAVAGHGFGGSAAVFAAAGLSLKPQAVVSIFPTVTSPAAEQAAAALEVPGVVFSGPGDSTALRSNAVELAHAWRSATLRVITKASPAGLPQGGRLSGFFGLPTSDRRTVGRSCRRPAGPADIRSTGRAPAAGFADPDVRLPEEPAQPTTLRQPGRRRLG
ncbi:dienelactone hydrolase family protein, partial [Mycolicibacter sinensis]|uniref:dienelactone hydrolase family protein n=1 Tax=Mycolicibacter sinensis (strain JDM601) TaxID=875328 RepID=UPI000A848B5F